MNRPFRRMAEPRPDHGQGTIDRCALRRKETCCTLTNATKKNARRKPFFHYPAAKAFVDFSLNFGWLLVMEAVPVKIPPILLTFLLVISVALVTYGCITINTGGEAEDESLPVTEPSPTATHTPTAIPSPTVTATPVATPTPTATPRPTPTPTPDPLSAYNSLGWLRDASPAVYEQIGQLSWASDGLSQLELDAADELAFLSIGSEATAIAIIDMPFLESVDPNDLLAIRALSSLAYTEDGALLPDVLAHPSFVNGITDDQTTLVAAAGTLQDPEEIRLMLHPGYAFIETVDAATALSPTLELSIVRTGRNKPGSTVETALQAIEFVEDVMQVPLPVNHVIIVLNEHRALRHQSAGANHGFAFTANPNLEAGAGHHFRSLIVHEIAHYYWRLEPDWIDEGVASIFEFMWGTELGISPGLLSPYRGDCEVHDLSALSALDPGTAHRQFNCNYFLGQMLFQELLEDAGNEDFSEGLRALYRLQLSQSSSGLMPGIAQVREAFRGQSVIVEKHWSGKVNAPENRPAVLPWLSANLIQWDILPAYDGSVVEFQGTVLGGASLAKQTIQQARTGGFPNFTLHSTNEFDYVGTILPPLAPDDDRYWILDDVGDVVANTYSLRDSTFTVRFVLPSQLDSSEEYAVLVWGFQDESRMPIFGNSADTLGYAIIRTDE